MGIISDNGLLFGGISVDSASKLLGILIGGNTYTGGVTNAGKIGVNGSGSGIKVNGTETFSGGIVNSAGGTLANEGILVTGGVSTFLNGITNSGTITVSGNTAIHVGNVSTFSGGIVNNASGKILGPSAGIVVSGTISTFSGGITNSGTISTGNAARYFNRQHLDFPGQRLQCRHDHGRDRH